MTTTKTTARRAVLDQLGSGGLYAASDTSANLHTIICAAAFKSTALPANHLAGAWVHVPSVTAPRQRQVLAGGLDPTTGTITLGGDYGSVVQSGVTLEVSQHLPLIDGGAKSVGISIDQAVNLGLGCLKVRSEEELAITTADAYELTANAVRSIDRTDRLVRVQEPNPMVGRRPIDSDWRGWELSFDGDTPILRCDRPFRRAVGNLLLTVDHPADTWIFPSGGSDWAFTPFGLDAENDQAWPDVADIVTAALVFCYAALADSRRGEKGSDYRALYAAQLAAARTLRFWDHTRDSLEPPAPAAQAASGAAA